MRLMGIHSILLVDQNLWLTQFIQWLPCGLDFKQNGV